MQRWWERWRREQNKDLYDVYKHFSSYKKEVWKYIKDEFNMVKGTRLRVIASSTNIFTVAFIVLVDNKWEFWVYTRDNRYVAVIPEELQKVDWRNEDGSEK